jgi:glycosyltransferase involved in cell wall biosynthesis
VGALKSIIRRLLSKAALFGLQRGVDHEPLRLGRPDAPMRLLIVANAMIPTLYLSLLAPLKKLIEDGECFVDVLTEREIVGRRFWQRPLVWLEKRFRAATPTCVVFCRYSGPYCEWMLDFSTTHGLPTVYCIDDDLLNVPPELGRQKFEYHNQPSRLGSVRYLLDSVDVVYCSNPRLQQRLRELGVQGHMYVGRIFCAGTVISEPVLRPIHTIGYMGFDHAHDFEIALPAVTNTLRRYPGLRFELFGRIPKPTLLDEFGDRVVLLPAVEDYDEFLQVLASRRWDVGICPLANTEFNRVKNINKWIEYTVAGAAVVASGGMIYDECCADNCGILVSQDQWESSLEMLIEHPEKRVECLCNAQRRITNEYSLDQLRDQLLDLFWVAMQRRRGNGCMDGLPKKMTANPRSAKSS